jgi:2-amino-4-hydroxy-6-hydroxymethyldihydropteridine diphosphokinase
MNTVFLSLGSNRGNRRQYLLDASASVTALIGRVAARSSVYETAPWGFADDTPFLNMVLEVLTPLGAGEILDLVLSIERSLGRTRGPVPGYLPRTIDIDILFFNNEVIRSGDLVVPHPRIALRKFVLAPLAEIAPDLKPPESKKTIRELLEVCPDKSEVRSLR